jgi:hypothetical protein
MKIIAKFAFVLLVGVFVVFGGSTSAKASTYCDQTCGTAMNTCAAYCSAHYNPEYSGFTNCINQCEETFSSCKKDCSN